MISRFTFSVWFPSRCLSLSWVVVFFHPISSLISEISLFSKIYFYVWCRYCRLCLFQCWRWLLCTWSWFRVSWMWSFSITSHINNDRRCFHSGLRVLSISHVRDVPVMPWVDIRNLRSSWFKNVRVRLCKCWVILLCFLFHDMTV